MNDTIDPDTHLDGYLEQLADPMRPDPPPVDDGGPGPWHRLGGHPERPDRALLSYAEGLALACRVSWRGRVRWWER
jgi:hypothetical protein